jgi:nucleoside-diphosphate-sugar epimerase
MADGSAIPPHHVEARAGDLPRSSLNIERAAIQLGWKPWTSLAEGTASVLEDRRQRPGRRAHPIGEP